MLVSVIIPVYNVEKYLNKCIESVVQQTYENLEVILVDDGSTDNSGNLCDEWSQKDSRIKVIHKENGGLSSARNKGNSVSSGDYIFYLDSDDYISKECIGILVQMCNEHNSQISITKMMYVTENTNQEVETQEMVITRLLNSEEAIEASLYQELFSCCAPAKLYKREIIEDVEFPVGRLSEDLATCHLFLNKAKKITFTNSVGYYYRQHVDSIMHVFNPKRIDALEWSNKIEKFCEKEYPNILTAAKCRTFNVSIHLLLDLPNSGEIHDLYFDVIWSEIKRTRITTLLSRKVRFREKAAAILSYGGDKILKLAWNSNLAVRNKNISC